MGARWGVGVGGWAGGGGWVGGGGGGRAGGWVGARHIYAMVIRDDTGTSYARKVFVEICSPNGISCLFATNESCC